MGTPDFAVPTLDAICDAGHEVVLVVAQPDRRSGRGKKLQSPPVAARAKALGLPLSQPRAIRSGRFPARVVGLQADVAVVIAYGRILTTELLAAPRLGCVNVHASLLPRWRGAAPIQASILAGDVETGVCTQRMEEGLDTGPIYDEIKTPLDSRETAGQLHDRLMALAADVAVRTLAGIEETRPVPQPHEGITWAPKISKADGRVDWTQSAQALDRRIRSMTPWPGGWSPLDKGALKIKSARPVDASGPAGTILSLQPLVVACGAGGLELETVQAPGRRPVSGVDYANGARLVLGESI
jgi:methionyl-tRNA formyltransferase